MAKKMDSLNNILSLAPVIPVIVLDDISKAKPLAKALVAGGLPVIEVTLRTKNAFEIIKEMAKVEGAIIGSGTIRNSLMMQQSVDAGCQFMVSPGAPKKLLKQAKDISIPLLPGIASATEIMAASEMGYKYLKFFPAEGLGGANMLKNFISPFQDIKFCPTGGISSKNAKSYLELSNVICVGGSWVVPKGALGEGNFDQIHELAKHAASLCY
ncbi:MAG: bifunctional 4-hydroxy-2-oxoglutarate aldolase/2-dehydro-3-deoxy-phosphogluconate aldolase [Devosiaceae bacterium]|nr:bifunctional 4-hydroxy-2-oxoglutarate aldolase/2-dehydro-3-deoxy-phosphogluconate aldolase [Devosiaceae bacterium]